MSRSKKAERKPTDQMVMSGKPTAIGSTTARIAITTGAATFKTTENNLKVCLAFSCLGGLFIKRSFRHLQALTVRVNMGLEVRMREVQHTGKADEVEALLKKWVSSMENGEPGTAFHEVYFSVSRD